MQKYREHVQQLQLMDEKEKLAVQLFNAGLSQVNVKRKNSFRSIEFFFLIQEIQEKSSKIQEMASVMQQAIEIDDRNSATQEERINALLIENRTLRQILTVHQMKESSDCTDEVNQKLFLGFSMFSIVISDASNRSKFFRKTNA